MDTMTFIATGDSFVTQRIPKGGYPGFSGLKEIISAHDVGFANLETTFHDSEGTPSAVSGGTWAMSDPRCLDDMCAYGFNIFTTANNHSGDYGEGGVMATIRHLKERDMVYAGTGANLAEASRPCYLETPKGRVALIGACSSFHLSSMAGGQSGEVTGRPGLNPLRFTTTYHVTKDHFEMVKELVKATYVNAYDDYGIQMGYGNPKPEGKMNFGTYQFALDERDYVETAPHKKDMERVEKAIQEAGRQADAVIVSIHAHETDYDNFATPPGYLEKMAKRCIDAGACAVIGHGPHELRGIEIYHGGLICYSLGNFIFQAEMVGVQPFEAYANKGMPFDSAVGEYMDKRTKNGTAGFPSLENIWRSVMASWTLEDGKLKQVKLYPLSLRMQEKRTRRGTPMLAEGDSVLRYMAELSRPFGTDIKIEGNIGYIDL